MAEPARSSADVRARSEPGAKVLAHGAESSAADESRGGLVVPGTQTIEAAVPQAQNPGGEESASGAITAGPENEASRPRSGGRPPSAPHRDPVIGEALRDVAEQDGTRSPRAIEEIAYRVVAVRVLLFAWEAGDRSCAGLWTPSGPSATFRRRPLAELGRLAWPLRADLLENVRERELVMEHAREVCRREMSDREAVRYLREARGLRSSEPADASARLALAIEACARGWMRAERVDPESSRARTLLVLALRRVRTEGPR